MSNTKLFTKYKKVYGALEADGRIDRIMADIAEQEVVLARFHTDRDALHSSKQGSTTRKINAKAAEIASIRKALAHFQSLSGAAPPGGTASPAVTSTGPSTGGCTTSTPAPDTERAPGGAQDVEEREGPSALPSNEERRPLVPPGPNLNGSPDGTDLDTSALAGKTLIQTHSAKSFSNLIRKANDFLDNKPPPLGSSEPRISKTDSNTPPAGNLAHRAPKNNPIKPSEASSSTRDSSSAPLPGNNLVPTGKAAGNNPATSVRAPSTHGVSSSTTAHKKPRARLVTKKATAKLEVANPTTSHPTDVGPQGPLAAKDGMNPAIGQNTTSDGTTVSSAVGSHAPPLPTEEDVKPTIPGVAMVDRTASRAADVGRHGPLAAKDGTNPAIGQNATPDSPTASSGIGSRVPPLPTGEEDVKPTIPGVAMVDPNLDTGGEMRVLTSSEKAAMEMARREVESLFGGTGPGEPIVEGSKKRKRVTEGSSANKRKNQGRAGSAKANGKAKAAGGGSNVEVKTGTSKRKAESGDKGGTAKTSKRSKTSGFVDKDQPATSDGVIVEGGEQVGAEAGGQTDSDEVEADAVEKPGKPGKSKKKQEPKLHWVLETLFIVKETGGEVVESLVRVKVPIDESWEERRELDDKGDVAIHNVETLGVNPSSTVLSRARKFRHYCVEIGATSRLLIISVFILKNMKTRCHLHSITDRASLNNDEEESTKGRSAYDYRITGVPLAPTDEIFSNEETREKFKEYKSSLKKKSPGIANPNTIPTTIGEMTEKELLSFFRKSNGRHYLHCGCDLEHAIFDFFLWKTLPYLSSNTSDTVECLGHAFDARHRSLNVRLLSSVGIGPHNIDRYFKYDSKGKRNDLSKAPQFIQDFWRAADAQRKSRARSKLPPPPKKRKVIPYVDPDDLEGPSVEFDSPSPPASPPAKTLRSLDDDDEEEEGEPSNIAGSVIPEGEVQRGEMSKPGAMAKTTSAKEVRLTHAEERPATAGDPRPNAIVKTERMDEDRLPAPKDSNASKERVFIDLTLDSETSDAEGEEDKGDEGEEGEGEGEEESEEEEGEGEGEGRFPVIGDQEVDELSDLSDVPDEN